MKPKDWIDHELKKVPNPLSHLNHAAKDGAVAAQQVSQVTQQVGAVAENTLIEVKEIAKEALKQGVEARMEVAAMKKTFEETMNGVQQTTQVLKWGFIAIAVVAVIYLGFKIYNYEATKKPKNQKKD